MAVRADDDPVTPERLRDSTVSPELESDVSRAEKMLLQETAAAAMTRTTAVYSTFLIVFMAFLFFKNAVITKYHNIFSIKKKVKKDKKSIKQNYTAGSIVREN